jgi:hypothetical protein
MRTWRGDLSSRALQVLLISSAAIAVGMGLLARRGSWYGDDLDLLVDGARGFSPQALLAPANDHVVPGLRFVFAAFAHLGFDYDITVVWRVVVQLACIVLLGLLVHRLTGSPGWALAGAVLYGVSPLSIPAYMQLSAAVNDVHAQLFGLVFLHTTVDWFESQRVRSLVLAGLSLLACLGFWLKAGLVVVTAMALVWFVADRVRISFRRDVLPWLATSAVPVAVFGALVLTHRRPGATQWPGVAVMARLIRDSVARAVVQPFSGGPWAWTPTPPLGAADPPAAAVALGAVVLGLLVALAAWRARRVLPLWGSVAVFAVATVTTVAPSRYQVFGDALTSSYHYWSDLTIPAVLATVITLRTVGTTLESEQSRAVRNRTVAAAGILWLVGAVASHAAFARQWGDNPARTYFATVSAELARTPTAPNLWNTTLPPDVSDPINLHRRVGEVFAMAGYDVRIQQPDSAPEVVGDDGRIRPARLAEWASATVPPNCGLRLRGRSAVTLPLSTRLPPGNWYVSMAYLANPDADLTVWLEDSVTGERRRLDDHHRPWPSGFLNAYLEDTQVHQPVRADHIHVESAEVTTDVCLGTIRVGLVEEVH